MSCKTKKVKNFKENEKWYIPPDDIRNVKKVIEMAIKHAPYSDNPSQYYNFMNARLTKINELEKLYGNCVCGIKFSGNICYIPG